MICTKKCVSCNIFYLHWFYLIAEEKKNNISMKYESIMRKRNWTLVALIDTTLYLLVCTLYLVLCLWFNWRDCSQLYSYTPHARWWCEKEMANAGLRDNVYTATCRTTKLLESNLRPTNVLMKRKMKNFILVGRISEFF